MHLAIDLVRNIVPIVLEKEKCIQNPKKIFRLSGVSGFAPVEFEETDYDTLTWVCK